MITTATTYTLHRAITTALDKLIFARSKGDWMSVTEAIADLQNGLALHHQDATQSAALGKMKSDRMIADGVRMIVNNRFNGEDLRDLLQQMSHLVEMVGVREGGER